MKNKCITINELGITEDNLIKTTINDHRIYVRGYNYSLNENTKIYRYMRLSSLLDLLFYEKFHVSNRSSFTDLREKKGLYKLTEELPSFATVPNYQDRLRMKKEEKDRQRALSLCISCWTLDRRNNGRTNESFLMWKAYSSKDEIICRIGTTIGQLIDSIKETSYDIIIADVDYGEVIKMNDYEALLFRKSMFYEDEQEVRMVVFSDSPSGIELKIDNKLFVNEIKLSPFIPPILSFFILRELKEWCKKDNINIEYSKVMEYIETNKNYKRSKNSRL